MKLLLLDSPVFLVKNGDKSQPVERSHKQVHVCMCVCGKALHADHQLFLSLDKSSEPSGCHKLHHRGDAVAFPYSSRGAFSVSLLCRRRENGKSRDYPSGRLCRDRSCGEQQLC